MNWSVDERQLFICLTSLENYLNQPGYKKTSQFLNRRRPNYCILKIPLL